MEREQLQDWTNNGQKVPQAFTEAEMARRAAGLRTQLDAAGVDAALLTSYHNVCYYSGFLYCQFGRTYGLVVDADQVTVIAAGIDAGQPWRRSIGRALTYTDWQRGNYFEAVRQLIGPARKLGVEFDHITLDLRRQLEASFPGLELIDLAPALMRMRMVKSDEEIAHITEMARIADLGGAAVVEASQVGTPEHEVALHSTATMVREIATSWPDAELMDTWTWFQSGINTDGAHNPVTSRRIERGDILSMNCFPMVAGYYVALERTLFAQTATDENLRLWEFNCKVHDRGKQLLVPGRSCGDIAKELNAMYEGENLLQYRSFGYGHSFGVLCHYYGREAGLELREDCETMLKPGMVVSMEPMITIREGQPGAGGYREHDILVITEDGNRNITGFPYGPDALIVP